MGNPKAFLTIPRQEQDTARCTTASPILVKWNRR